jgi:DNA-binding transcriptional ArsR family regulator
LTTISSILFTFALFLNAPTSSAKDQSDPRVNTIKKSPAYLWGEREAADRDEARRLAEEELLRTIGVAITVSTSDELRAREGSHSSEISDEFLRTHRSFTGMYLKGLNHIETQSGKLWQALAFIHRDSLAESFELRKTKIREFARAGKMAADQGRIGEALRNYYWGSLLAQTYPDTICLPLSEATAGGNAQVALSAALKALEENILIEPNDCYQDGKTLLAPVAFHYYRTPVTELSASYYDGNATSFALVVNGEATFTLYDLPSARHRPLTLSIEFTCENEMASDPEIAGLYDIFKDSRPSLYRTINLTFPWLSGEEAPITPVTTTSSTASASPSRPAPTASKAAESPVPEPATEAISVLQTRTNTSDFLEVLEQYHRLGLLTYGNRSQFPDRNGCYVGVADETFVRAVLYYDGRKYRSLSDNTTYDDLATKFKGCRQIWIKENR